MTDLDVNEMDPYDPNQPTVTEELLQIIEEFAEYIDKFMFEIVTFLAVVDSSMGLIKDVLGVFGYSGWQMTFFPTFSFIVTIGVFLFGSNKRKGKRKAEAAELEGLGQAMEMLDDALEIMDDVLDEVEQVEGEAGALGLGDYSDSDEDDDNNGNGQTENKTDIKENETSDVVVLIEETSEEENPKPTPPQEEEAPPKSSIARAIGMAVLVAGIAAKLARKSKRQDPQPDEESNSGNQGETMKTAEEFENSSAETITGGNLSPTDPKSKLKDNTCNENDTFTEITVDLKNESIELGQAIKHDSIKAAEIAKEGAIEAGGVVHDNTKQVLETSGAWKVGHGVYREVDFISSLAKKEGTAAGKSVEKKTFEQAEKVKDNKVVKGTGLDKVGTGVYREGEFISGLAKKEGTAAGKAVQKKTIEKAEQVKENKVVKGTGLDKVGTGVYREGESISGLAKKEDIAEWKAVEKETLEIIQAVKDDAIKVAEIAKEGTIEAGNLVHDNTKQVLESSGALKVGHGVYREVDFISGLAKKEGTAAGKSVEKKTFEQAEKVKDNKVVKGTGLDKVGTGVYREGDFISSHLSQGTKDLVENEDKILVNVFEEGDSTSASQSPANGKDSRSVKKGYRSTPDQNQQPSQIKENRQKHESKTQTKLVPVSDKSKHRFNERTIAESKTESEYHLNDIVIIQDPIGGQEAITSEVTNNTITNKTDLEKADEIVNRGEEEKDQQNQDPERICSETQEVSNMAANVVDGATGAAGSLASEAKNVDGKAKKGMQQTKQKSKGLLPIVMRLVRLIIRVVNKNKKSGSQASSRRESTVSSAGSQGEPAKGKRDADAGVGDTAGAAASLATGAGGAGKGGKIGAIIGIVVRLVRLASKLKGGAKPNTPERRLSNESIGQMSDDDEEFFDAGEEFPTANIETQTDEFSHLLTTSTQTSSSFMDSNLENDIDSDVMTRSVSEENIGKELKSIANELKAMTFENTAGSFSSIVERIEALDSESTVTRDDRIHPVAHNNLSPHDHDTYKKGTVSKSVHVQDDGQSTTHRIALDSSNGITLQILSPRSENYSTGIKETGPLLIDFDGPNVVVRPAMQQTDLQQNIESNSSNTRNTEESLSTSYPNKSASLPSGSSQDDSKAETQLFKDGISNWTNDEESRPTNTQKSRRFETVAGGLIQPSGHTPQRGTIPYNEGMDSLTFTRDHPARKMRQNLHEINVDVHDRPTKITEDDLSSYSKDERSRENYHTYSSPRGDPTSFFQNSIDTDTRTQPSPVDTSEFERDLYNRDERFSMESGSPRNVPTSSFRNRSETDTQPSTVDISRYRKDLYYKDDYRDGASYRDSPASSRGYHTAYLRDPASELSMQSAQTTSFQTTRNKAIVDYDSSIEDLSEQSVYHRRRPSVVRFEDECIGEVRGHEPMPGYQRAQSLKTAIKRKDDTNQVVYDRPYRDKRDDHKASHQAHRHGDKVPPCQEKQCVEKSAVSRNSGDPPQSTRVYGIQTRPLNIIGSDQLQLSERRTVDGADEDIENLSLR